MVALWKLIFAYHSTLAIRAERRGLLFRIAVTEYFVFALLFTFTSALVSGLVESFRLFDDVTAIAESGVSLRLPVGVHAFVASVGLVYILKGFQFDLEEDQ